MSQLTSQQLIELRDSMFGSKKKAKVEAEPTWEDTLNAMRKEQLVGIPLSKSRYPAYGRTDTPQESKQDSLTYGQKLKILQLERELGLDTIFPEFKPKPGEPEKPMTRADSLAVAQEEIDISGVPPYLAPHLPADLRKASREEFQRKKDIEAQRLEYEAKRAETGSIGASASAKRAQTDAEALQHKIKLDWAKFGLSQNKDERDAREHELEIEIKKARLNKDYSPEAIENQREYELLRNGNIISQIEARDISTEHSAERLEMSRERLNILHAQTQLAMRIAREKEFTRQTNEQLYGLVESNNQLQAQLDEFPHPLRRSDDQKAEYARISEQILKNQEAYNEIVLTMGTVAPSIKQNTEELPNPAGI